MTHVQQTASRCFATLRQLRSIRRCIPTSVFNSLVSALVLSRLDIQRLQSVQNAAVRLIFNLRRCDHITDELISLHWLCVPEWIIFKVATLTYRALHGSAPHHLTWRRHSHALPTFRTNAGLSPPPLNSLTFRPVVSQLSEVVPFLLLEQRRGMACQAMSRRPRCCRCSRTGWRYTSSAAVTNLFDFELHFFFLVSGPCNSFHCLGHSKLKMSMMMMMMMMMMIYRSLRGLLLN